jgi:hypothetical protein
LAAEFLNSLESISAADYFAKLWKVTFDPADTDHKVCAAESYLFV